MDPFWDAGTLTPNKRTKEFTHVLAEVVKHVNRLDGEDGMEEIRIGTEAVRSSVVRLLDEGLENYVQNFRFEYPET